MIPFLSDIKCKGPSFARIGNPERRQSCEKEFLRFCEIYFCNGRSDLSQFENPRGFQLEFCATLQSLILSNFDKRYARAAPRGYGKTTLAVLATIWAILYGHKNCIVWFCVNGAKAKERLDIVQNELMHNPLLNEDFPEICNALKEDGWSDTWADNGHQFSNGAWLLGNGIDGANLGTNKHGSRPDFLIIDDPEDTSTIRKTGASDQTITAQKRFNRIDKEMAFLGQPGKPLAMLMVTTIRSRGCLSDEFTDPKTKPAWNGKVYKAMILPKEGDEHYAVHKEYWDNYLQICSGQEGPQIKEECFGSMDDIERITGLSFEQCSQLDQPYRRALRYFAGNHKPMTRGVIECDTIRCPLHKFYWLVGSDTRGKEVVWSELQNEPLEDEHTKMMRFTSENIFKHVGECQENQRLDWTKKILCSVYMGLNEIHWEAKCISGDFQRKHLLTCGVLAVDQLESRETAISESLAKLDAIFEGLDRDSRAVVEIGGETNEKSEWREVVMNFCMSHRPRWIALRKALQWTDVYAVSAYGRNYYFAPDNNPFGVIAWNQNHYKNRVAVQYKPKSESLTLFKPDETNQRRLWDYVAHQCSEQYTLTFIPGKEAAKATIELWVPMPKYRDQTAWWNCAAMTEMLADYVSAIEEVAPIQNSNPLPRIESARRRRF